MVADARIGDTPPMKANTLIPAGLAMVLWLMPHEAQAATVPAGTALVVQTLQAVSSTDVQGTRFAVRLSHNVAVAGKAILPVGTKFSGKVQTSRRLASSSQRLTVDLTDVQIGGRVIPIRTTGARELSNDRETRRGVQVSRGAYTVAAGKRLEFHLAQPLNL
jgi:hypothetical protein